MVKGGVQALLSTQSWSLSYHEASQGVIHLLSPLHHSYQQHFAQSGTGMRSIPNNVSHSQFLSSATHTNYWFFTHPRIQT